MLSPEEQKNVKALKAAGKTNSEVMRIIAKQRIGEPTTQEPESPSVLSTIGDAAKSSFNAGVEGYDEARNAKGLGELAHGTLKFAAAPFGVLASPLAPAVKPTIGAAIDFASENYGKLTPLGEQHFNEFAASPLGEGVARGAENVQNLSAIAGGVAAPDAVIPGLSTVSRITRSAAADLGSITASGTEGIQAATASGQIPATLMQRVARISKGKQIAFEERAGQPVGQYLVDRGIFGTPDKIVDQLYTRFTKSKETADNAIAQLPGTYRNTAVGTMLKELEGRERSISSPGAISKDLERVMALNKKMKGQGLDMREINEVKRLYERNVKLEFMKDPSKMGQEVARASNLDSAVRGWQLSTARQLGLKNLDTINRETMLARQLMDDLGAEYSGQAGNNAISITDWITLSGGSAANAAMLITKKALTSKTVMSYLAEKMSGSTPKVGAPKADIGAPTIDNYLDFIKRTDPKDKGGGPNYARPSDQANAPAKTTKTKMTSIPPTIPQGTRGNSASLDGQITKADKGPWPTTASKQSAAKSTSTGNAPTGKGGVSAQKAGTSDPFEGGDVKTRFEAESAKHEQLVQIFEDMKAGKITQDEAIKLKNKLNEPTSSPSTTSLPNRSAFNEQTKMFMNSIREIGGYKIGNVGFHDKPWKVVGDETWEQLSKRSYQEGYKPPIAEFRTRDELWSYLKQQSQSSPPIPKELEPLASEARKYKTAEEFASNLLFHGTLKDNVPSILKDGLIGNKGRVGKAKGNEVKYVSLTPDPDAALHFSSGRGGTAGMVAVPRPKNIYDLGDIRARNETKTAEATDWIKRFGTNELYWGKPEAVAYLKSKGHDAISFMNPDGIVEIRVLGDIKNTIALPEDFIKITERTAYDGKPTQDFSINTQALTDFFNKVKGKK